MMDDRQFARVLLLAIGTVLFFAIVLFILSPILALLMLALAALVFTLLWFRWPRFRLPFQKMRDSIKEKLGKATKSPTEEYDTQFRTEYRIVNTYHGRNKAYPVTREMFVIGRSKECDLVIDDDPTVSRQHCRIVYRKYSHTYYLEDLNSASGTYLGIRRLEPYAQEKLLDQAKITISDRTYRFERIGGDQSD